MSWIPTAIGGIEAIAGLTGGHPSYGATQDLNTGKQYLSQEGNLATQDLSQYNGDDSAYRQAVGNETRYLQTNPYTSQFGTQQEANALSGNTASFQAARSNLSASLARRGLTDSSQQIGGQAGIDAQQAASTSGAENSLAQAAIRNQGQRLSALTSLQGGLANQDYSRGVGLLGNVASNYLNIGNQERGLQMNANAASNSLIGSGAGLIAGSFAPKPDYGGNSYNTPGQVSDMIYGGY